MADTVRTRSDLLTNLFQDGQADSSITEQDMRDFIISVVNRGGWADYNDTTTAGTPINITGGGGYVDMTNDGAGTNSQNRFVHPSITDLWDTTNNYFDFSQLELYDEVDFRFDLQVTTTTANQQVDVGLEFASGDPAQFTQQIYTNVYKAAGAQPIRFLYNIYMGSNAVLNNPAKIQVQSDSNATVVVNGWKVSARKH